MKIRVLIADDHEMVRRGLRTFLELHDDMEVVADVADGAACLQAAAETKPDVVLLDLKMPGLDAVSTVRGLAGFKVLIVTSFSARSEVMPAIRAGAAGLVYKDIDPAALANAIRSVHAGHVLLPPDLASALMTGDAGPDRLGNLTPRERDVLAEIAHGRSNKEIAKSLRLAEKTVKTHVSSILMKLNVEDRTQAALYAVRHNL
ncbi:LuxR C-terminal-related transcriptional regulator [Allorhizocola rhizosphaerae]|uniref:LuxR C-terminal-related transcriptional regulator n=1 Tax=Allorhizocola rhizosphaerae TaxID=1872709 RepID=UPI000E3CCB00|nr:response regulator transcription factor [Allorhizocola rhizosphaerae]